MFLEELEDSLHRRDIPRQTQTRTSFISILDLPEVTDFQQVTELEYLIKTVNDIIFASNSKLDELQSEDVVGSTKRTILDILLRLNGDVKKNIRR